MLTHRFLSLALATTLMTASASASADSPNVPPPPPAQLGALAHGYPDGYAGMAVDELASQHHHHGLFGAHKRSAQTIGYDYGVTDTDVMYHGHWAGTMTGSWNEGPVRTWQGSFDSANGQTHWQGHYVGGRRPDESRMDYDRGYHSMNYGRPMYGYAMPMYEEVLVPSQPIITKTVTTHSYYVDVPVYTRRVVHHAWHPSCGCAVAPQPRPVVRHKAPRIMGS